MKTPFRKWPAGFALLALLCLPACKSQDSQVSPNIDAPASTAAISLEPVDVNDPVTPQVIGGPVTLTAAKNEWTSFVLRVNGLPKPNGVTHLTLSADLAGASPTGAIGATFYEILPMPVNTDRAGYARYTGLSVATRQLPRALLPMGAGSFDIALLRDPAHGTDPQSRGGGDGEPPLIWVDLHVRPDAAPGDYAGNVTITEDGVDQPLASLPVKLTVFNFAIAAQRHLQMVAELLRLAEAQKPAASNFVPAPIVRSLARR